MKTLFKVYTELCGDSPNLKNEGLSVINGRVNARRYFHEEVSVVFFKSVTLAIRCNYSVTLKTINKKTLDMARENRVR